MDDLTKHKYKNLMIAILIVLGIVAIFVFVPIKLILWISAIWFTLSYINIWLVTICTSVVERKYEQNFDFIYRIICMFLMSILWGIIIYIG